MLQRHCGGLCRGTRWTGSAGSACTHGVPRSRASSLRRTFEAGFSAACIPRTEVRRALAGSLFQSLEEVLGSTAEGGFERPPTGFCILMCRRAARSQPAQLEAPDCHATCELPRRSPGGPPQCMPAEWPAPGEQPASGHWQWRRASLQPAAQLATVTANGGASDSLREVPCHCNLGTGPRPARAARPGWLRRGARGRPGAPTQWQPPEASSASGLGAGPHWQGKARRPAGGPVPLRQCAASGVSHPGVQVSGRGSVSPNLKPTVASRPCALRRRLVWALRLPPQ